MRICPSQSTVIKRKVGSMAWFTTVEIEAVAFADGMPVGDAGAAQWIDAEVDAAPANRLHVDHRGEIGNVGARDNRAVGGRSRRPAQGTRASRPRSHQRGRRWPAARSNAVTWVSAGHHGADYT